MYKCFISGGCSFTAGHELVDFTEEYYSSNTWDFIVKNKLCPNAEMIRTAKGGLGNASICRRVIHQVHNSLKRYKHNEIFVTVMWSGRGRKEFFYFDNDNENDFVKTYVNDVYNDAKTEHVRKYNEERKKWLNQIGIYNLVRESYKRDTHASLLYYTLKEIEYLKTFLEANNISYKFTSAYNDKEIDKKNAYIDGLQERLDIDNTFVNYKQKNDVFYFNEFTDLKGYARGKEANHPLEYAHQNWATLFLNNL